MKLSIRLCAIALALLPVSAMADNYGTAGCGLGALVFADQPGKIQIVSATLNNLVSPQTFAITSGTSNCVDNSGNASTMFIEINKKALRKDMSRGQGESLAGLSQILNCKDQALFGAVMQKNLETVFPTDETSAQSVNGSVVNTIKSDAKLAQSCGMKG